MNGETFDTLQAELLKLEKAEPDPSKPSAIPAYLEELKRLLARCIEAGRFRTVQQDRADLQWLARDIADMVYRFEHKYPDAVILPAQRIFVAKLPCQPGELLGRERELSLLDQAWANPQAHIVMVTARGGAGKTTLVSHWLSHLEKNQYAGAASVYVWSFYSQGAAEDRQVSEAEFLAEALKWFGDPDPTEGSPWNKGVRLAELIRQQRTLIILDGLEPLQFPPGERYGRFKEQGIPALLLELAQGHPGLCILTSRVPVPDLVAIGPPAVRHVPLKDLSVETGVTLLKHLGVKGTDVELADAAEEFHGHALALTLLGRYLAIVHGGEVRKRDSIPALEAEQEQGGHARRAMKAYELWFEGRPELEVLYLLGLFDRPVEIEAIQVLREPPIPGLTDRVSKVDEAEWKYALHYLQDLCLVTREDASNTETLDCHALVREYFGSRIKERAPEAWKEGHRRLFSFFRNQVKELPKSLDEMEPLFRAVAHGCFAGCYEEALREVFIERIERNRQDYSVRILGAPGKSLAALSGFFARRWDQPASELQPQSMARVLDEVSWRLQVLGRLQDAVVPRRKALEQFRILAAQGHAASNQFKDCAYCGGRLSELYLYLGKAEESLACATEADKDAEHSQDPQAKRFTASKLGNTFHQMGRFGEAKKAFLEAEEAQRQVEFARKASNGGFGPAFYFCDLLLSLGELTEVRQRAKAMLALVREGGKDRRLDEGFSHLAFGKACLLESGQQKADLGEAQKHLEIAAAAMRHSMVQDELPRALLALAELYRLRQNWEAAQAILREVRTSAARDGMKLYLADYHLEALRLDRAVQSAGTGFKLEPPTAREHYEAASRLITETGYRRRQRELEELGKSF